MMIDPAKVLREHEAERSRYGGWCRKCNSVYPCEPIELAMALQEDSYTILGLRRSYEISVNRGERSLLRARVAEERIVKLEAQFAASQIDTDKIGKQ